MKKYSSSFFVYEGERRIFLSTDSAVINVKILKEIYSKFPDLDKYGYRKQLSSLKKNYVICLNTTQTIDLVFLNMLSSDKIIFITRIQT